MAGSFFASPGVQTPRSVPVPSPDRGTAGGVPVHRRLVQPESAALWNWTRITHEPQDNACSTCPESGERHKRVCASEPHEGLEMPRFPGRSGEHAAIAEEHFWGQAGVARPHRRSDCKGTPLGVSLAEAHRYTCSIEHQPRQCPPCNGEVRNVWRPQIELGRRYRDYCASISHGAKGGSCARRKLRQRMRSGAHAEDGFSGYPSRPPLRANPHPHFRRNSGICAAVPRPGRALTVYGTTYTPTGVGGLSTGPYTVFGKHRSARNGFRARTP